MEAINRPAAEFWRAMVRFLVLANAGGAVAVLSFVGASSNANHGAWLALVPLGFFFTGVVSAVMASIGQAGLQLHNAMLAAQRILNKQPKIPKITSLVIWLRRASGWPELLAFVFFILGGGSGLVFLGILLAGSDGTTPTTGAAVTG
ncbi:MAG: hypothetical protein ACE1ZA_16015 [Pseudomonadales bacterium]